MFFAYRHVAVIFALLSASMFAGEAWSRDDHPKLISEPTLLAPQVSLPIVLILKDTGVVQDARIVLSDVVECQGARMICEEIYGVDVGKSPDLGKSFRLKKETIADLAKSEWPTSQIDVQGPEFVNVSSMVSEITGRDLEAALQKTIDREMGNDSRFRISVEVAQLNKNLKVVGSNNYFSFPDISGLDNTSVASVVNKYAGNRRFEVQIFSSLTKEIQLSTKVSFTLQVELFAPVAKREMQRAHFISPSEFTDRWVVLTREQDPPIINIAEFSGFALNRRVQADEPIRQSYLDMPHAIKRGQMVSVRLSNGQVEIMSKAKAAKDGAVGEIIDVVLIGTQKHALAKILTKNEVLIQ